MSVCKFFVALNVLIEVHQNHKAIFVNQWAFLSLGSNVSDFVRPSSGILMSLFIKNMA